LRAIKAVYAAESLAAAGPGAEEFHRAIDAALDAVAGPSEAEAEARMARDLAAIRTGEDAIKFFTRYTDGGGASGVKLLYCNRPPPSSEGGAQGPDPGPYDLVVVPKDQAQPEYFTISASGVVHFRPGQLSECMPLSEWMQHALMFRVLCSMTFFRLYPHRKALSQWRANARHACFCRQRSRLARRCFLAKPLFVGPVLEARRIAAEAETVEVLQLPEQCMQLEDFTELQTSVCLDPVRGARRQLEAQQEALGGELERLVLAVGRAGEVTPPPWERAIATNSKGKPMLQEKKEAREQSRRVKMAKEDEGMVGSCVRLAALVFQATLAAMLHRAAGEMARRVLGAGATGEPPRKLLCVAAELEADGDVALRPAPEAFEQAMDRLWEDALGAVDALPPLESASARLRAVADAAGAWRRPPPRSVREILSSDRAWLDLTANIAGAVRAQLAEAHAFARSELQGPCSRVQRFGMDWREAAYAAARTAAQPHAFAGLSEDMERMRSMQEDLAKCRVHRVVGSIVLDARALRDGLVPVTERALGTMKQALGALAREACATACRRLDAATRTVDERPEGPASFAAYTQAYAEVAQEQNALEEAAEEVRCMYELLGEFGVRIPLEDKVELDALRSKERDLTHRAMLEARLFIDRQPAAGGGGAVGGAPTVTITVEASLETTTAAALTLGGSGGLLDL